MLYRMAVIVQKYGGSSVADVNKLKQVAERVMRTRQQGHDVVVVVSAMGDTTDELLAMAKQVSPNPARRELDMLLSAGERISMALLSMAIRELGGDAISFTGSQSGIITNDRHVDARIIEVRPFRVQDELARKDRRHRRLPGRVVQEGSDDARARRQRHDGGRDGGGARRRVLRNLLGRRRRLLGGSARRAGGAAHRHAVVRRDAGDGRGRREGAERAGGGVREGKGIAIYARATSGPLPGLDPSSDGTVVRKSPPRMPGTVVGVASEKDVLIIDGEGPAADLLAVLDERGVSGKQLHIYAGRTTLAVSRENLHNESQVRDALRATLGDRVRLVDGLAAVSVVGAGINATYANVRAGSDALAAWCHAGRHRDLVVPHHLDDPERPDGRRRPGAAQSVYRSRATASFPKGLPRGGADISSLISSYEDDCSPSSCCA